MELASSPETKPIDLDRAVDAGAEIPTPMTYVQRDPADVGVANHPKRRKQKLNSRTPTRLLVALGGPALQAGMYYQFKATSWRSPGGDDAPISTTEDLRGVFSLAE